jgi:hypothetical protein
MFLSGNWPVVLWPEYSTLAVGRMAIALPAATAMAYLWQWYVCRYGQFAVGPAPVVYIIM